MILNQSPEELFFGLIYLVLSTPLIPFYIIVIFVVHQKSSSNVTYKLITLISIFQFIPVICHFITSLFLIFPYLHTDMEDFVVITGSFMNSFYNGQLPTVTVLAVCRVLIFGGYMRPDKMHFSLKSLLLIIVSGQTVELIYSLMNKGLFIFIPPGWVFNPDVPHSDDVQFYLMVMYYFCLSVSYASYIAVVFMIYLVKKISPLSNRKDELFIMIQYTITVFYTTATLVVWDQAGNWYDANSPVIRAMVNVSWIVADYMNPILLLVFNRSVRIAFFSTMGLQKSLLANFLLSRSTSIVTTI